MSNKILDAKILDGIMEPDRKERHDMWLERVNKMAENAPPNSHTLEYLRPERAVAILMALEEGVSHNKIIETIGGSYRTINGLKARHSGTIQERRREFSQRYSVITEMGTGLMMKKMAMLEEDEDELKKTPLKDLALATAIATDKGSMMDGMATQIIETRRGPSISDAFSLINAAKARVAAKNTVVEADVIESQC